MLPEYVYMLCLCATYTRNTNQQRYNQESGTSNGTQSGRNTSDRKSRHPVTPKLIITTTYCKSTIDNVHNAVDSLNKCVA
jgi:hypothetical protein